MTNLSDRVLASMDSWPERTTGETIFKDVEKTLTQHNQK